MWRAYPSQSLFATCNFGLLAQNLFYVCVSSNGHMCALPVSIKLPLSCTVYVFDCLAVLSLMCGQMILHVATMCGQIHDCLVTYCVIHKQSYGYSGIWDSIGCQGIMWTCYVHITIHVWLYVHNSHICIHIWYILTVYIYIIDLQYRALGGTICLLSLYVCTWYRACICTCT